ncbi:Shikimate O-hydroxycinnamoyltransferase [Linum perenne]
MKVIVTVNDTTIVRPHSDTPRRSIWLSNMDLLHGRIHLPTIYLYKPDGSDGFFDSKSLKDALSKLLDTFYPAAGRLSKDENGRIEIDCNGEGVLFREAETDLKMSDLGEFMPGTDLLQFVPRVDYSAGLSSYPLFVTQVTRFSCGGVCLGTGWHHTVADGEGALSFINAWSDVARGKPVPVQPFLDRTLLRARSPPSPKFEHEEYAPPPSMISGEAKKGEELESTSMAILEIPIDLIDSLKERVNRDNESKTKYSTYQILTSHIWRAVTKARDLPIEQPTKLHISTDGRTRLNPPLPKGYLGNCVFHATPIARSGELLSEPLIRTVDRIHDAIKKMDDEYLRSAIDYLEDPNDSSAIMQVPGTCRTPNLKIISWMRLPFECADFGWGKPIFNRPANLFEGKGNILPKYSVDGNLSLALCLETYAMDNFRKTFYDVNV